jgi:uncharacterized protein (DUF58 family)
MAPQRGGTGLAAETAFELEEACRAARRLRLEVVRRVTTSLTGAYASVFHGTGSEFRDFRPYVAGDDLRRMDWLVTARRQSPYVRRYVEERQLRVLLAVDVSRSMQTPGVAGSPWRTALHAAAALALAAVWNHDRVGGFAFSDGVDLSLPPRSGERHALSFVRSLLSCRPHGRATDAAPVLERLARVRRHALVFLVSDLALGPALWSAGIRPLLAACAGRHRLVVVRTAHTTPALRQPVLVSTVDPEGDAHRLVAAGGSHAEAWKAAAERERKASGDVLRQLGIALAELPPGPDCAGRLAAALRRSL